MDITFEKHYGLSFFRMAKDYNNILIILPLGNKNKKVKTCRSGMQLMALLLLKVIVMSLH